MSRRRWIAAACAVPLCSASLAACGLTTDGEFEEIPSQFGLDQTTTTTSTTTTTLPTTVSPEVTAEPTTTQVAQETVEVYFVLGFNDLQSQSNQFSAPVPPLQVLKRLEEGPSPGPESVGLRTEVRPGLAVDVETEGGVATVDLDGEVLDQISPPRDQSAIAQIVLTLGRLRGIGQVRFTIDGEPASIGIPPDYTNSEPGQPLSYDDFAVLLATPPAGAPPTATTTTTVTTAPPSTAPPPTTSTTVPAATEPPADAPATTTAP
jgi:hypothetical protein